MMTSQNDLKEQKMPSSEKLDHANPFHITKSDPFGAVTRYVSGEEKSSQVQGQKVKSDVVNLKIWQKGRSGATVEKSRAEYIKDFLKDPKIDKKVTDGKIKGNKGKDKSKSKAEEMSERIEAYLASKDKRDKRETLADFMAKKKEIFILQMLLNTKKEEIRKLDERAQVKEEALKMSEKSLEEDASRFDIFLKENDRKAQDALRTAEKETKKKMQKIQEIKKLNQQIQIIQSNISKTKDSLEECQKLKTFLCQLTPAEWSKEQKNVKHERQMKRRKKRIEAKRLEWKKEQERRVAEEKARQEEELINNRKKRRQRKEQIEAVSALNIANDLQKEPSFEDELLTSSDEDIPMYFSRPQKLLDIFSALEEENLFLIQNVQEAEQSLDEVTIHFKVEKEDIQQKSTELQKNVKHIKQNILTGKQNISRTKKRVEGKRNGTQKKDNDLLDELGKKVKDIYQLCGFNDAGSSPSTLFMLSEIEASMDSILNRLEDMPYNKFRQAQKLSEKSRRESKRAQQQAQQEKMQEERNRRAIERSMQPPKRRVGRPVMHRSRPQRQQKVHKKEKVMTQEEIDECRHLS